MDYLTDPTKIPVKKVINKAWCVKRLVSKKKRRFENDQFDLDMAYITKRVIAMGYPATGCEKMIRNSIDDVIKFFSYYHNDNVKIYNLCLEKDRIYDKSLFKKSQVGLFPATDHNPCPIKLILEFCVDICLYLIKNSEAVAAVHCKAGKGRTGVMICSYLIFSGLCKTSEEAFVHYAASRTYNNKGVTIPSQIRYIQYFETFLASNFCPPYIFLIPKIIKTHLNLKTTNILKNFKEDKTYFISPNEFCLKRIKIGPLKSSSFLNIKICDFINTNIEFYNFRKDMERITVNGETYYYFIMTIHEEVKIESDIKISIAGSVDCYFWMNLWYSSLDIIKTYLDNFHSNKDDGNDKVRKQSITAALMNQYTNEGKSSLTFKENTKKEFLGKVNEMINLSKKSQMESSKSNIVIVDEDEDVKKQFSLKIAESDEDVILTSANNKNLQSYSKLNSKQRHSPTSDKNLKTVSYLSYVSEPNEDDNLFDILFKLKHNTNLNVLINQINKIIKKQNKLPFDKTNMTISLSARELDKFSNVKKMHSSFAVQICYALLE